MLTASMQYITPRHHYLWQGQVGCIESIWFTVFAKPHKSHLQHKENHVNIISNLPTVPYGHMTVLWAWALPLDTPSCAASSVLMCWPSAGSLQRQGLWRLVGISEATCPLEGMVLCGIFRENNISYVKCKHPGMKCCVSGGWFGIAV